MYGNVRSTAHLVARPLLRSVAVVVLMVIIWPVAGCGPAFKEKQAKRDQRIRNLSRDYAEYDAAGRKHIDWLVESERELALHREVNLQRTIEMGRDMDRHRAERWEADRPQRNAFLRDVVDGRVDEIPCVIELLFY